MSKGNMSFGLLLGFGIAAVAWANPWPAGDALSANAWLDADGELVTMYAAHLGGRRHRTKEQVLYCDAEGWEERRAELTGISMEVKGAHALRVVPEGKDGVIQWKEYCSLDLYRYGVNWIKRERGEGGALEWSGAYLARKLSKVGLKEGLSADEYLCAMVLKAPPVHVREAIASDASLKLFERAWRYNAQVTAHREVREKWQYYGVDTAILCGPEGE